jgi:hypothetical protein
MLQEHNNRARKLVSRFSSGFLTTVLALRHELGREEQKNSLFQAVYRPRLSAYRLRISRHINDETREDLEGMSICQQKALHQ